MHRAEIPSKRTAGFSPPVHKAALFRTRRICAGHGYFAATRHSGPQRLLKVEGDRLSLWRGINSMWELTWLKTDYLLTFSFIHEQRELVTLLRLPRYRVALEVLGKQLRKKISENFRSKSISGYIFMLCRKLFFIIARAKKKNQFFFWILDLLTPRGKIWLDLVPNFGSQGTILCFIRKSPADSVWQQWKNN